jgi:hypothetical protein
MLQVGEAKFIIVIHTNGLRFSFVIILTDAYVTVFFQKFFLD